MNRINVNQIKQVGAFTFLYFSCDWTGVLVGNLVDHQGNMFYAPAFSALFGGMIYRYYLEKNKRSWIYLYSWLRDRILSSSFHVMAQGPLFQP